MKRLELLILMRIAGVVFLLMTRLAIALGRRLPRNVDPVTGKDRLTGARLQR